MPDLGAADLAVVIPTRDRWDILRRCLDALQRQTARGFEVVVVVDGEDQAPPDLGAGATVLRRAHDGPGAARNMGARSTSRPLLLFLGDDIIPTPRLVAEHLGAHARHPAREDAVLGGVAWDPSVARNRINRWLDWSATQFEYERLEGERDRDVGWGRFYSSNVSLKADLFHAAGGFDEDYFFLYEDTDLGYRLGQLGMRLYYAPDAAAHHLHGYTWPGLEARIMQTARSERLMAAKHPWFEPFFKRRLEWAARQPPQSALWARLVDAVPRRARRLRRLAERHAGWWYDQRLHEPFMNAWEGERDLEELKLYLGARFDRDRLWGHHQAVEDEARAAVDEATFYRTSEAYLYDLTVFAMSGTKTPYLRALRGLVPPGARVLEWGCGIGSDGLRLMEAGYQVDFADFDNPSTRYLRWRLAHRGLDAPVHDLDRDVPGGFDLAFAFDVIEHVDDPFAFLAEMESRARLVMVNLLEPDPADTHLHRDLPIAAILARARALGLAHYTRHHQGRSHLVAYRSGATQVEAGQAAERGQPLARRA